MKILLVFLLVIHIICVPIVLFYFFNSSGILEHIWWTTVFYIFLYNINNYIKELRNKKAQS